MTRPPGWFYGSAMILRRLAGVCRTRPVDGVQHALPRIDRHAAQVRETRGDHARRWRPVRSRRARSRRTSYRACRSYRSPSGPGHRHAQTAGPLASRSAKLRESYCSARSAINTRSPDNASPTGLPSPVTGSRSRATWVVSSWTMRLTPAADAPGLDFTNQLDSARPGPAAISPTLRRAGSSPVSALTSLARPGTRWPGRRDGHARPILSATRRAQCRQHALEEIPRARTGPCDGNRAVPGPAPGCPGCEDFGVCFGGSG